MGLSGAPLSTDRKKTCTQYGVHERIHNQVHDRCYPLLELSSSVAACYEQRQYEARIKKIEQCGRGRPVREKRQHGNDHKIAAQGCRRHRLHSK